MENKGDKDDATAPLNNNDNNDVDNQANTNNDVDNQANTNNDVDNHANTNDNNDNDNQANTNDNNDNDNQANTNDNNDNDNQANTVINPVDNNDDNQANTNINPVIVVTRATDEDQSGDITMDSSWRGSSSSSSPFCSRTHSHSCSSSSFTPLQQFPPLQQYQPLQQQYPPPQGNPDNFAAQQWFQQQHGGHQFSVPTSSRYVPGQGFNLQAVDLSGATEHLRETTLFKDITFTHASSGERPPTPDIPKPSTKFGQHMLDSMDKMTFRVLSFEAEWTSAVASTNTAINISDKSLKRVEAYTHQRDITEARLLVTSRAQALQAALGALIATMNPKETQPRPLPPLKRQYTKSDDDAEVG
ncbi:hypothetical protein GHT06_003759 [Daphnia sinensis]|uniref:Uncharacterized protein n=1 Tax=Daphnia sinensis TaxID=1820382 RepID=A0AAD5L264_9CRUS|nr:hypothetical protein GHT06_003759 [Daphnia sinensis]